MNNEEIDEVIPERVDEEEVMEELETQDDGSYQEVYRSRAGNIVTHPKLRSKGSMKDPRQQVCWDLYVKSWRAGTPNAKAAALAAGYSENTAANVSGLAWFKQKKEKLRRSKMMDNAERNISRMLNMGITKLRKLEDGSTEEVFDAEKARIVADMSKLIVTTLGKDLGYSSKTEVKVESLPTPIMELDTVMKNELIGNNDPVVE